MDFDVKRALVAQQSPGYPVNAVQLPAEQTLHAGLMKAKRSHRRIPFHVQPLARHVFTSVTDIIKRVRGYKTRE